MANACGLLGEEMPSTLIDLRKYAGQWIAQETDGDVVDAADTYAELIERLHGRGIDPKSVAITEVKPDTGIFFF